MRPQSRRSETPAMKTFTRAVILAGSFLAIASCGGGGSDGANAPPTVGTQQPATGRVSILITDAPIDRFCQIRATVESIDLLGGSSRANVFTGPETVDVLALRNYTDAFALNAEVPAGSVAIGGNQTGVYPFASPGGWHLIGHSEAVLFDPDAQPPALLTPGTRVRFA